MVAWSDVDRRRRAWRAVHDRVDSSPARALDLRGDSDRRISDGLVHVANSPGRGLLWGLHTDGHSLSDHRTRTVASKERYVTLALESDLE